MRLSVTEILFSYGLVRVITNSEMSSSDKLHSLEDDDVLMILANIAEHTEEVTENHLPAFYDKFQKFATDLNRLSRQMDNDGLRKTYFHVAALDTPLNTQLNHDLQNRLVTYFDENSHELDGAAEGILKNAATAVQVDVVSDVDGRDTIDVPRLQHHLSSHFASENTSSEPMDEPLLSYMMLGIEDVFDNFVEHHGNRLINYYSRIEDSCVEGASKEENKWHPVLEATSEHIVDTDKKAISWMREK